MRLTPIPPLCEPSLGGTAPEFHTRMSKAAMGRGFSQLEVGGARRRKQRWQLELWWHRCQLLRRGQVLQSQVLARFQRMHKHGMVIGFQKKEGLVRHRRSILPPLWCRAIEKRVSLCSTFGRVCGDVNPLIVFTPRQLYEATGTVQPLLQEDEEEEGVPGVEEELKEKQQKPGAAPSKVDAHKPWNHIDAGGLHSGDAAANGLLMNISFQLKHFISSFT